MHVQNNQAEVRSEDGREVGSVGCCHFKLVRHGGRGADTVTVVLEEERALVVVGRHAKRGLISSSLRARQTDDTTQHRDEHTAYGTAPDRTAGTAPSSAECARDRHSLRPSHKNTAKLNYAETSAAESYNNLQW